MPKYMLLLHDNRRRLHRRQSRRDAEGRREIHRLGQEAARGWSHEGRRQADRRTGEVDAAGGRSGAGARRPYSESKEVLGGYYMIEAASYEQAIEHARDCPQLDYGGTIEVREVDAM